VVVAAGAGVDRRRSVLGEMDERRPGVELVVDGRRVASDTRDGEARASLRCCASACQTSGSSCTRSMRVTRAHRRTSRIWRCAHRRAKPPARRLCSEGDLPVALRASAVSVWPSAAAAGQVGRARPPRWDRRRWRERGPARAAQLAAGAL